MIPDAQVASCGDVSCEMLVDPIPRPRPAPFQVTTRPTRQRVVLVDNHKPNALRILQRTQRLLREREIEVADEIYRKPNASLPLSDAELDKLSADGGLVLCGISDCGSCSAASSMDSVLLQKRGAAGIAILTRPFADQVDRLMAYQHADRVLPAIVLDHPMQMVDDDELQRRALQLAAAAERLLVGAAVAV